MSLPSRSRLEIWSSWAAASHPPSASECPPGPTTVGPETSTTGPIVARSRRAGSRDRKSTRLNSSHTVISYAVFCLKKKKTKNNPQSVLTDHTYHRHSHTNQY